VLGEIYLFHLFIYLSTGTGSLRYLCHCTFARIFEVVISVMEAVLSDWRASCVVHRHPEGADQPLSDLTEDQKRELAAGADPPRKKIRQFDV